MSTPLVRLGVIVPLTILSAITLSIWGGVGGCACTSSLRIILMCTDSLAMMYRPDSSASVADIMTCLMMCAMLITAPLFGGTVALLDRRKCPPARLHALGSLR